jgi:hypothetical protein
MSQSSSPEYVIHKDSVCNLFKECLSVGRLKIYLIVSPVKMSLVSSISSQDSENFFSVGK